MLIKFLTITISLIIFILVLELVREEKLTFKYAVWWLLVSSGCIFFTIFDHIVFHIFSVIGFTLPSHFIFFTILCVFVFFSFLFSCYLCQQNRHNDTMAQKIGIMEFELRRLKEEIGNKKKE